MRSFSSLVTLVESPKGFLDSMVLFAVVGARVVHGRQIAPPILRL